MLIEAEAAKAAADEAAKRVAEAAKNAIAEMEFVSVPAGEFLMGSTSSEASDDEKPMTRVRISRGFWLGKYEVTQAQWYAVMGSNPSRFDECGPDCPVESVSWDEVQEFIRKLNEREREGIATGYRRRRSGSTRRGRGRAGIRMPGI